MTTTIDIPAVIEPVDRPEGDPGGAESLATSLLNGAVRLAEFCEEAESLAQSRWYWQGKAADAYGEHAKRFAEAHLTMSDTLKRVARGVDVFADRLRALQSEHTDITGDMRVYARDRADLLSDVNDASDVTEGEIAVLQERARILSARRTAITGDISELIARTAENEEFLVQLFTGADTASEAQSATGGVSALALSAIASKPRVSAGPEAMNAWWRGLSAAEQDALITAYPDRLGSADGLPASARDAANRLLLEADLADLEMKEHEGTLAPEEKQKLANARAAREALDIADGYVLPGTNDRPGGQLWLYDPEAFDGDGRVAIAVGDLDTADDVSVQIPGIRTGMVGAPGGVDDATRLYESARYNGDGSSVATMFWLGYNTPAGDLIEWGQVPSENRAADGGERLAAAVDGLRASRADDPAHMTAIGHSYGSTATSYAATEHDLAVDDVALIGSPGAGPADHASDFSVGADHVYDGRNSRDFVALLGDEGWARKDRFFDVGLGIDPSSEDFGAQRFEAESTDRGSGANLDDHVRYYDRDSESLYNLGRIVDGHGEDINDASLTYDPWWWDPIDPEWDRDPTENVPSRSDTGRGDHE
ncbi:alpha/beta hydrolase [Microbacterium sp.]|uniref:alpha/beta hydrolase n=1 Tax=Microbacterium sp. TaxID=51671 RepID=UPI0028122940|nr:alpha/beta hydrolase [Microbacterium sp.]